MGMYHRSGKAFYTSRFSYVQSGCLEIFFVHVQKRMSGIIGYTMLPLLLLPTGFVYRHETWRCPGLRARTDNRTTADFDFDFIFVADCEGDHQG